MHITQKGGRKTGEKEAGAQIRDQVNLASKEQGDMMNNLAVKDT